MDELQDVALNEIIPDDEFDSSTQIKIEIRPGVGGSEGSLFAEDILNMF